MSNVHETGPFGFGLAVSVTVHVATVTPSWTVTGGVTEPVFGPLPLIGGLNVAVPETGGGTGEAAGLPAAKVHE